VPETQDQDRSSLSRRRMRPAPIKNGWALIVIAVALVIFMVLTIWFTTVAEVQSEARITDREVIHRIADRLRQQWPQVPGPPHAYLDQSRRAFELGDLGRSHQRTTMALALDADSVDAWLLLVIIESHGEGPATALSLEEAGAVLLEVGDLRPDHPLLPVAMGFLALRNGDNERALSSVGTQPKGVAARLLRLRALGEKATIGDGQAVLEAAQAHGPACRWTASRALEDGRSDLARAVLLACVKAGADTETGEMLAQLLPLAPSEAAKIESKTLDSMPAAR